MIDLNKFRVRIHQLCRELSLRRLDLIGSAAREDFSDESDIDVLVTFGTDENLFERYFTLKAKLEEIFGRKVDVVEERAIRNPFFKQVIEKDRVNLYGA